MSFFPSPLLTPLQSNKTKSMSFVCIIAIFIPYVQCGLLSKISIVSKTF